MKNFMQEVHDITIRLDNLASDTTNLVSICREQGLIAEHLRISLDHFGSNAFSLSGNNHHIIAYSAYAEMLNEMPLASNTMQAIQTTIRARTTALLMIANAVANKEKYNLPESVLVNAHHTEMALHSNFYDLVQASEILVEKILVPMGLDKPEDFKNPKFGFSGSALLACGSIIPAIERYTATLTRIAEALDMIADLNCVDSLSGRHYITEEAHVASETECETLAEVYETEKPEPETCANIEEDYEPAIPVLKAESKPKPEARKLTKAESILVNDFDVDFEDLATRDGIANALAIYARPSIQKLWEKLVSLDVISRPWNAKISLKQQVKSIALAVVKNRSN